MKREIEIRAGYRYIAEVQDLFARYVQELDQDLAFQDIGEELRRPEKKYAPPRGALLVAADVQNRIVGCVAFRPLSATRCELKRLYVLPACRSKKIGRLLLESAVEKARQTGYAEMLLDTFSSLQSAVALYESYGFAQTEPYYKNPLPDVLYLKRSL